MPSVTTGQHEEFHLRELSEDDQLARASHRAQTASARASIAPDRVSAEAFCLHPLAVEAQKRLKQKNIWPDNKQLRSKPSEVLDIEVTKHSIDRAVQIASVVIRELEAVGATIRVDKDKAGTILELHEARLLLKISEHVARTRHAETPAETRAMNRYCSAVERGNYSVGYPNIPRYDFTPTGTLTISALGWPTRNWRDTPRCKLDQRIGQVVAGIIALANEVRDREIETAKKREEYARKVDRYQSEMTRREEEKQAFRRLRADAKKWEAARRLREYIGELERAAISRGTFDAEMMNWLSWAASKADWLDPTIFASDAILDAPEPENPGYCY